VRTRNRVRIRVSATGERRGYGAHPVLLAGGG
jgi:hypothetical protein